MKRTSPVTLVVVAVISALAGVLLQFGLAAGGIPKYRPEYTLAVTLALIAVVVVALAVPVRRATRSSDPAARIDPFYATRVVVLAKASSIAGALLAGVGFGFMIELLVRSGSPTGDAFARVIVGLAAAVALLVAGLVSEHLCRVPPDDRDQDDDAARAG